MRKMATSLKPILHIAQNGTNWNIKTETSFKTVELACQEGIEFSEDTLDGRKSKTIIRSNGNNAIVQEQRDASSGALVATITREVRDDNKLYIVSKI
jgi:cellular retinoic acid-binding protein 1